MFQCHEEDKKKGLSVWTAHHSSRRPIVVGVCAVSPLAGGWHTDQPVHVEHVTGASLPLTVTGPDLNMNSNVMMS